MKYFVFLMAMLIAPVSLACETSHLNVRVTIKVLKEGERCDQILLSIPQDFVTEDRQTFDYSMLSFNVPDLENGGRKNVIMNLYERDGNMETQFCFPPKHLKEIKAGIFYARRSLQNKELYGLSDYSCLYRIKIDNLHEYIEKNKRVDTKKQAGK